MQETESEFDVINRWHAVEQTERLRMFEIYSRAMKTTKQLQTKQTLE